MNSINKLLIILFVSIVFGACEEMLEPEDSNIYTKDRVYKDPSFAEGIMLRAYQLLPTSYGSEDVATDDAVSNDKSSDYLHMATGRWSATYDPMSIWRECYEAISHLNYFLSFADDVEWSWQSENRNDMFKKRLKGEALALRAYYHMRLLMYYGNGTLGVPMVTSLLSLESNWQLSRNTYQECVTQIRKDFDDAYNMLPYTWEEITDSDSSMVLGDHYQNRINGEIVRALKARLTLHVASPAYNNDEYDVDECEVAAILAGDLLDLIGGVSGLDANGLKFYDSDSHLDVDEIFWRNNKYQDNEKEGQCFPPSLFGDGDINPTQNLVDAFPMANGYPISATGSGYDPENPYQERDPRLTAYIVYNGNTLGTATIETDVDNASDGLNQLTTSTRTGYYLKKLLRPDVNLDPTVNSSKYHIYAHIRYTELFLIYAEAANQVWGPDGDPEGYGFTARSVIGAIRQRAGISSGDPYLASLTTKEEMARLIQNERRLELCFEGFRFHDLRRWQLDITETTKGMSIDGTEYTQIDVETRDYQSYMYYAPIPQAEVLKNNNLLQNQGW